jgi:citrate lyase subunit beta/citryl-CoA lyase
VPDAEKLRARGVCAEFVTTNRARQPLFVRINALATGLALDDLAAVVRAQPYGIMLPKCTSGRDVARVDTYLSELEARDGLGGGSLRILPIVTESAAAMFELGSYAREAGPRLCGMLWGRDPPPTSAPRPIAPTGDTRRSSWRALPVRRHGRCTGGRCRIHRLRDVDGLRAEARAVTAGFSAKAAIHPGAKCTINEVSRRPTSLAPVNAIVAAFAQQPPGAGAVNIGGGCPIGRT